MSKTMLLLVVFLTGCVDTKETVTIPTPTSTPAIVVADTAQCYRYRISLTRDEGGGTLNCYGPDGNFHSHYLIGRTARPLVWRVEMDSSGRVQAVAAKGESDG